MPLQGPNARRRNVTRSVHFFAPFSVFALLLFAPAVAGAQQTPPGTVGRIEGADISVDGGTAAGNGSTSDAASIFVASGSVVTVHSGKALITLIAGGQIDICGPAKFHADHHRDAHRHQRGSARHHRRARCQRFALRPRGERSAAPRTAIHRRGLDRAAGRRISSRRGKARARRRHARNLPVRRARSSRGDSAAFANSAGGHVCEFDAGSCTSRRS
jgi:hypothetical protein